MLLRLHLGISALMLWNNFSYVFFPAIKSDLEKSQGENRQ